MFIDWQLAGMAVALTVVASVAAFPADGSASGWLEVKGKRVELKYAFAVMSEDMLSKDGKEKVEVLLSDKPVPAELRKATDGWSMWAGDQAAKGELQGIVLYIEPDSKTWNRGQKLSKHGMEFYTQTVSSPELSSLIFAPAQAAAGEIAGKVSMKKAMSGVDEDDGPWRLEAEFRTPIVPRPAITGNYTGAEARNSAPYKAVQAYLQASQKRDLETLRKALSPSSREMMSKFEAAQGRKAVLDMLAEEAAGTSKLKLTRVTVRGDEAEVVLSGDSKEPESQQVMRLVLEGGVWKIGQ